MTSARDSAIATGLTATRSFAGVLISYRRGTSILPFKSLRGRRLPELDGSMGQSYPALTQVHSELTDWIFPISELATLTPPAPAIGDTVVIGGKTYSAMAAEDGKHWRYLDPAETWVRMHAVLTG
jgi:hypothetical protein